MHPTLLYLGTKPVSAYDFFIILGYTIGIIAILIIIKKQNFPFTESLAYLLFAVAASLVGAKIFLWIWDFIQSPAYYFHNSEKLWHWPQGSGGTFGALLGAVLFSFWYLKKFQLPFWPMGDTVAPGIAVAQSIMKLGCFMAGCCYGTECSLPWAVTFPGKTVSRHPTQIYEAVLYFLNFLFLLFVFKKRKFPGQVIALYIINFSALRFLIEYFRGDPGRKYLISGASPLTSLSYPQIICLAGIVFGIGLIHRRSRFQRKTNDYH